MTINPLALPTFVLAATLFWLGSMLLRKSNSTIARGSLLCISLAVALPCILSDLFYTHLFDSWLSFYRFRTMRFSELTLSGIGLIAGMLYGWMEPEKLGEKLIPLVGLIIVLGLPFSKPVLAPLDLSRLQKTCETEVCLQSTGSTCGPSSAATLLKLYGHGASEKELAREAFTYRGGTEAWYLARALRQRGFIVEFVLRRSDSDPIPAPSIAGVVLPGGAGHFVAVLSNTQNRVVIGDPLSGKLEIQHSDLNSRYHFTGFFLTVRPN